MSQQVTVSASDQGSATETVVPARSRGSSRQVRLAALPSAVPWARRILGHMLREWQLEGMSDPALLLVSELVTNAVRASVGQVVGDQDSWPVIGLTLQLTEAGLHVEVWDSSSALPVMQEADLTGERGRGLVLVDFLADTWGHRTAGDGGKVVWCTVAIPGEPVAAY
jgi:anti-sigma regulatory factor (Ser/Thr protein kinase)